MKENSAGKKGEERDNLCILESKTIQWHKECPYYAYTINMDASPKDSRKISQQFHYSTVSGLRSHSWTNQNLKYETWNVEINWNLENLKYVLQ